MTEINVLDPSVYNRIAAGEVVERPASVVKELVENSLDAGATSISVEIRAGGRERIRVVDNGKGIAFDDLAAAFLPHATSKIRTAEDLDAIGTLGFRGEALASIAAVADVDVLTKPAAQPIGGRVVITGGAPVITEAGCPDGTYFTVSKLFARIPARAKFLDGDRREEAAVTDLMARLILSRPSVAFRFVADGRQIYRSYGQGIADALRCVYGAVEEQVIAVDERRGDMHLYGFLGRESFSKPNRSYQTLVVNERYVSNQTVSNAVFYAYADRLMKRQYPFYVLYLDLPADRVDVNVHPNKLDVRFEDKEEVYSFVNTVTAAALAASFEIPRAETPPEQPIAPLRREETGNVVSLSRKREPEVRLREPSAVLSRAAELFRAQASAEQSAPPAPDGRHDAPPQAEQTELQLGAVAAESKALGVAFRTYLILQIGDDLYFVDQHAAHERLLYDAYCARAAADTAVQELLLPYVFHVEAQEDVFLARNLDVFRAIGFGIEPFGRGSYKISAVPALLEGIDLAAFVAAVLADPSAVRGRPDPAPLRERLMQEACKAAVKGGDELSPSDVALLVERLSQTGATLLCPHGRPVAVRVERRTVEKWFKRIVN